MRCLSHKNSNPGQRAPWCTSLYTSRHTAAACPGNTMLTDSNLITTIKTLQELIVILILACFDVCINSGSKGDKFTSARLIRK